jgi:hypothetical protein
MSRSGWHLTRWGYPDDAPAAVGLPSIYGSGSGEVGDRARRSRRTRALARKQTVAHDGGPCGLRGGKEAHR